MEPVLARGKRWRIAEQGYPDDIDLPAVLVQVAGDRGDWITVLAIPAALDFTTATRPTPSAAYRWPVAIRVRDPGASETLQTCLKNADGSYGWSFIAMAPA